MPTVRGVLETSLYVENLERTRDFFRNLFGFQTLAADDRFCALNVADGQVLLLFRRGAASVPAVQSGGTIPAHDGSGRLHLAFAIAEAELSRWEDRLRICEIALESRVTWPRGGVSLYFRDPEGNLIELATPGLWAIY